METLKNQFTSKNYIHKIYIAPDIPLDKIANSLSQFTLNKQEKALALIDTSLFGDAKNCFVFTDKRMIWKEFLEETDYLAYSDLHNPNSWRKLPKFVDKDEDKDFGELLVKLDKMYNA